MVREYERVGERRFKVGVWWSEGAVGRHRCRAVIGGYPAGQGREIGGAGTGCETGGDDGDMDLIECGWC